MKNIKKIVIAFLSCLMMMNVAFAQEVTVDGFGIDKNSAVRDAMRNAVVTVVGSYIDSRTLVTNSMVALDEIYAKSQGFVNDINVLEETTINGTYRVRARINVDTNPNAQLMSRLNMIMTLNDPRIAVIVKKTNQLTEDEPGVQPKFDNVSETALNDALLNAGFSHIVDARITSQLRDSTLLSNIYNGTNKKLGQNNNFGIDYLVLGDSRIAANKISLPNRQGTYTETQLSTGRAEINVKIVKFDTGEIVATFLVDGQGVDNGDIFAQNKALRIAAEKAGSIIEEKFKKIAAKPVDGMVLTVRAADNSLIETLVNELRAVDGIENVYLREQHGNKATIEIESSQKAHMLVRRLKDISSLNIFVEDMSNSSASIAVSK